MKRILPFFIVISVIAAQIDLNEGPYGSEYFDIAGPFTLVDLNLELGDVNSDNTVNILDIIATVNHVLGYDVFTDVQIAQADLNFDGSVDILDIVALANLVLSPEPGAWDFETQWNGEESYIFFTLGQPVVPLYGIQVITMIYWKILQIMCIIFSSLIVLVIFRMYEMREENLM